MRAKSAAVTVWLSEYFLIRFHRVKPHREHRSEQRAEFVERRLFRVSARAERPFLNKACVTATAMILEVHEYTLRSQTDWLSEDRGDEDVDVLWRKADDKNRTRVIVIAAAEER